MGHAVYTLSDPRAKVLKRFARSLADQTPKWSDRLHLIESIERLTPDVFRHITGKDKPMCANVDLYSGFVYSMLNIPQDHFHPVICHCPYGGLVRPSNGGDLYRSWPHHSSGLQGRGTQPPLHSLGRPLKQKEPPVSGGSGTTKVGQYTASNKENGLNPVLHRTQAVLVCFDWAVIVVVD